MNVIRLKKYGLVLTGRGFGEEVMKSLLKEISYPVGLDFDEIMAMGSSFGEELIVPICNKQNGVIDVYNVNSAALLDCLKTIEKDFSIKINLA